MTFIILYKCIKIIINMIVALENSLILFNFANSVC